MFKIGITFFTFLFPFFLFAQNGTLTGTIVDAENGETLIGANVFIKESASGAATDLNGKFVLRLTPGTYSAVVSYTGYLSKTITDLHIRSGQVTQLDVSLATNVVQTSEEVVVEARAYDGTDVALLGARQKALAVSDAISSETISRSGSSNAADAMSKVTGASVVGGKYVYVRGLGDRYAAAQLNGIELPSADPDKRAFNFDLFPSAMLESINTLKTFTPDKPGSFSGGLIDVQTKSIPESRLMKLSIGTSMNTLTAFNSEFLSYTGSQTDFLGFDNGYRDLPEALAAQPLQIPSAQEARFNSGLAQQLDMYSKAFNPIMVAGYSAAPIDQSYSFSLGNRLNEKMGFVAGFSYNYGASAKEGRTGRYLLTDMNDSALRTEFDAIDLSGSVEANMGGLLNFIYQPSPSNEISFNWLYTRNGESSARYLEGVRPNESELSTVFQTNAIKFTERLLNSYQLKGKHFIKGLANATLEWNAALSGTRQDEPDTRFLVNTRMDMGDGTYFYTDRVTGQNPSRYFRNMEENAQNFNVDLSIPFKQWRGFPAKVKFGGAFAQTERAFRERIFVYYTANNFNTFFSPERTYAEAISAFFSSVNLGLSSTQNGRSEFNTTIGTDDKLRNNYDGNLDVWAGYGMVELPLTTKLKFVGGARFETTAMNVKSQDPNVQEGNVDNHDWLPSLNLIYQLSERMNLRTAFTKTLARPVFREIAPFESFDFVFSNYDIGNPNLKRTLINNYDIRWESFGNMGSILAFSLFHKDLFNPIEKVFRAATGGQREYTNVEKAKIDGAEIELRQSLRIIHPKLQFWNLGGNASFVKSSITLSPEELAERRAVDPNAASTRALQGQSPLLLNLDLSYINYINGTSLGLYYNVFSSRLTTVSNGTTPDIFERASPQLDFSFAKKFGKLNASIKAKNLLDADYKESYTYKGQDYNYYSFKRGRTFSFGLGYSF